MNYPSYVKTDEWNKVEKELYEHVRKFAVDHELRLKDIIMFLAHVLSNLVALSSEAYEGLMENAKGDN